MTRSKSPGTCKYSIFAVLLIIVLGFAVYSNTISAPFIFDDYHAIVENPRVRSLNLLSLYGSAPQRFLPYLSFAVNYALHGYEPWGYHLLNIVIHILAALAVWRLALLIFQSPAVPYPVDDTAPDAAGEGARRANLVRVLALFAGLLFLVHPVQTQAVSYVVQRMASMAALFYITAVWMYARARAGQQASAGADPAASGTADRRSPLRMWGFYGLSLLSALAAVHCKETAVTLPAAIVLYELCFGRRRSAGEWTLILPFAIIVLLIPYYRLNPDAGLTLSAISRRAVETENISRTTYLLTEFRVIVTYLRLLVLPVNQNLDYDYQLARGFFELRILLSFLLLSVIGVIGILAYWRNRLITFCVFWFYITLSVESTVIPIRDVIFEHRLYLPMPAYALLLPVVVLCLASFVRGGQREQRR